RRVLFRSTISGCDQQHSDSRLQACRELRVGFLQLHLLREVPAFLAERVLHGPVVSTDSTGAVAGSTAARVGFKKMRSVSNLLLDPLIQSHGRHAILANAHGLAIGLVGARAPSTRRNTVRARAVMSGIAVGRSPRLVAVVITPWSI